MENFVIYTIKCLGNNKLYVGSTNGFKRRKGEHLSKLRNNKHYNLKLQHSFNKYGEDSFVFEILEIVKELSCLKTKEQFWMNKLNACSKGLNCAKNSNYAPAFNSFNSKSYIITFPCGKEEFHKNLNEFSRNNNLHDTSLRKVLRGEFSQHKGYKIRYSFEEPRKDFVKKIRNENGWLIEKENGESFIVSNLYSFMKENQLNNCLRETINKDRYYKGFRVKEIT